MSQAVSSPPLVNADFVPNELNCPICFSVPSDPRLLPCEHIFCSSCITQAISSGSQSCPMCRKSCSSQQIRAISRDTAIYRIWSNIQVRCSRHENGCNWTGCIVDFTSHSRKCAHVKQAVDRSIIDVLNTEIQALESQKDELKSSFETTLNAMKSKIQALEGEIMQLKQNTVNFDGNYNFDRDDICKLSRLIARYLTTPPHNIDRNKIYQCVQNRYRDLETGWSDNPDYYEMDMLMLLSTCAASTWFTQKQLSNINKWKRDHYSLKSR